jgi:hypothetical protein
VEVTTTIKDSIKFTAIAILNNVPIQLLMPEQAAYSLFYARFDLLPAVGWHF